MLTSGCLATAFTWIQHHGVVLSLARSTNDELRGELLDATVSGCLRAGVAYAGVVPTPPRMVATHTDDGWLLNGHAPFVSGWGVVDLLQISARDAATDDVISAILRMPDLVGGRSSAAVRATPVDLSAAAATTTVSLRVDGLMVPFDREVTRVGLAEFFATQNVGVRLNGTLPFGLVRRCAALLDVGGHHREGRALRERADVVRNRARRRDG